MSPVGELAALFLKLGVTGFGGPAAHIAMLEDEVVRRRGWLSRDHFLDLVGATNLIPGPNSTEMAIHIGYLRAGWAGLLVAGAAFVLPAVLITAAIAWLYVRFGSLPQVAPFLAGIPAAVVAIIAAAVWRLGRTAAKSWLLVAIGVAVAAASLLGANEVLALFAGGLLGMLALRLAARRPDSGDQARSGPAAWLPLAGPAHGLREAVAGMGIGLASAAAVSLWKLGLVFLAVGSVLYGSGYVLFAFLEGWLVRDLGWLTEQQLLDAIAVGQFTPGPVLSTATFVGYVIRGFPGAAVATVGIFAPSFVFVALLARLLPRLRKWPWTAAFLDAVNASSIGLMAAVTVNLALSALTGWPAWLIAAVALLLTVRWRVNAAWLVLGAAVAGWLLGML